MMPQRWWCGCIPLPCQHNITAITKNLSKHKLLVKIMEKSYHI